MYFKNKRKKEKKNPLHNLKAGIFENDKKSKQVGSTHGSLWRSISVDWDRFVSYEQFRIGDGNLVRLWQDKWHENQSLKMYPELYAFTANKDASINSFLECQNDGNASSWNVRLIRDFNDW